MLFFHIFWSSAGTLTFFLKIIADEHYTPLSDVQPQRGDYTVCVRISRMWEIRGPNEENEVIHLDLVLIDSMVFS